MPAPSDLPLRKVTLNLYDHDCTTMELIYGHGWSEIVRNLVNDHANYKRAARKAWTGEDDAK